MQLREVTCLDTKNLNPLIIISIQTIHSETGVYENLRNCKIIAAACDALGQLVFTAHPLDHPRFRLVAEPQIQSTLLSHKHQQPESRGALRSPSFWSRFTLCNARFSPKDPQLLHGCRFPATLTAQIEVNPFPSATPITSLSVFSCLNATKVPALNPETFFEIGGELIHSEFFFWVGSVT